MSMTSPSTDRAAASSPATDRALGGRRRQAAAACLAAVGVVGVVLLLAAPTSAAPPAVPTGKATVSGRLWNDFDADGAQDAGEPGLAGVDVHLVNGGAFQAFATTAADGTYAFVDVPAPWPYNVSFDQPSGLSFSPQAAVGATPATDSDVDSSGATAVTVVDGQGLVIDAGAFDPSAVITTTTTTAPVTTTTTTAPATVPPTSTTAPSETVPPATTAPTTTVGAPTTGPATTVAPTPTSSTTEPAVVAGDDISRDPGTGAAVLATSTSRDGTLARTGPGAVGIAFALGLLCIGVGAALAAISRRAVARA